MAQIDLRNADIYIRDGYTATGAVNQSMTPPADGDTSITVSGFSKAIPVGNTFTIVGSTLVFTVVSTTGGATPTAIVFTPAIATASGVPVNAAVVAVGPNVLRVRVGEGNLTYEEKRNVEYVREKRQIDLGFVRLGDDEPTDVSIDMVWEFLTADTTEPPSIEDALKKEGQAAAWVTSGADPCEPYCVDVEVIYTPPCSGVKAERILLKEFRYESIPHDLKAGTFSAKGKCKAQKAIKTRVTPPVTP